MQFNMDQQQQEKSICLITHSREQAVSATKAKLLEVKMPQLQVAATSGQYSSYIVRSGCAYLDRQCLAIPGTGTQI